MTVIPLPRPTRRLVPVAALAVGALAVSGCGSGDDDDASPRTPPATPAAAASFKVEAPLAAYVPARAAAFAQVTIRPKADAEAAIEELSTMFGEDDPGEAITEKLDLDDDLEGGRTFEKDVLPNLGDHVGGFALAPADASASSSKRAKPLDGAIVAEVRDAAKVRAALEPDLVKRKAKVVTVGGQQVYRPSGGASIWFGEKTLVLGTRAGVAAAIEAATGDTLAKNERYTKALSQVRATDPVAVAWTDAQQAPALIGGLMALQDEHGDGAKALKELSSGSSAKGLSAADRRRLRRLGGGSDGLDAFKSGLDSLGKIPKVDATMAMAIVAKPGEVRLEAGGTRPVPAGGKASTSAKDATDAVAALPAGAWAAFGQSADDMQGTTSGSGSLSDSLKQLEQATGQKLPKSLVDTLAQVKTVAVGIGGDSLLSLNGGMVVRTADAAAAGKLMDSLRDGLGSSAGFTLQEQAIPGAERGLVGSSPGLPVKVAIGSQGDRVALGLSPQSVTAALQGKTKLSSDAAYKEAQSALGGDAPTVMINAKPLGQLLTDLPVDDLKDVVQVVQRIKLIAASRVDTSPTSWRGALVVRYDASAPAAGTTPGGGSGSDDGADDGSGGGTGTGASGATTTPGR